jgi:hypothetical protein
MNYLLGQTTLALGGQHHLRRGEVLALGAHALHNKP